MAAARAAELRKSRLRSLALEPLESRTLMSTLPASTRPTTPIVTLPLVGTQQGTGTALISNQQGSESSPSIVVDPNNPSILAAVWTIDNNPTLTGNTATTEFVEAAYSLSSGAPGSWNQLNVGNAKIDPTTGTSPATYAQETDGSIGFDRNDNLYILYSQHQASNAVGELLLTKYNFSGGGAPGPALFTNRDVYTWTADQAVRPTLTVDGNLTNVVGNGAQNDKFSGNVYVSWTEINSLPKNVTNAINDLRMAASSDGGLSFSGPIVVPNSMSNVPANNLGPSGSQMTVSAGSGPNSTATVTPGEVAIAWDQAFSANNDTLQSNRVTNGADNVSVLVANPGPVMDATKVSGQPDTPSSNPFTFNVNITDPNFTTLSNLTVTLGLTEAQMSGVRIQLIAPNGLGTINLVNNQVDGSGNAVAPADGISGANLGIGTGNFGTTFDDNATRAITDGNAAAPFIGHYRPETPLASLKGATAAQLSGPWTLLITVIHDAGSNGTLNFATLNLTSGFTLGGTSTIATTSVRGNLNETGFPTGASVTPQGIGPGLAIASDNTLGNFSANQGRLYATFVTHDTGTYTPIANPADNTDIGLAFSDNGGSSWTTVSTKVNDDRAVTDGFSEANGTQDGRPQFQPSVTVDNATGTVVLSWFDARNDPARDRVAVYTTTSIDGGRTFSPDVFVSPAQTATDAITGQTVVLGPIPENQSGGNADATNGYGTHQGLAAWDGTIYSVWGSNLNGDNQFIANGAQPTITGLQVRLGTATFAAGPRVVTPQMGLYSANPAADGTPTVNSFTIGFDRAVNPDTTILKNAISVFYQDTVATDPPIPMTVTSVSVATSNAVGALSITVNVAPLSAAEISKTGGVGTYYYSVSTAVADRLRTQNASGNTTGNPLDQLDANAAAASGAAYPTPFAIAPGTDVADTLPLMVPGPHVVSFQVPNGISSATPSNDLVLNGTVSQINVTFDRDMNPSSFSSNSILQMIGPNGAIQGPFTYLGQVNSRTFTFGFPVQTLSGTYTLVLNPTMTDTHGNPLDTNENAGLDVFNGTVIATSTVAPVTYAASGANNFPTFTDGSTVTSTITVPDTFIAQLNPATGQGVTVQLNITHPIDPDLQISLIPPPGLGLPPIVLVARGTGTGGSTANFNNTVFDDTATTLIANGGAPFFGRFKPQNVLNGLVGHQVNGTWTLQISDMSASGTDPGGVLNSWSLTFQKGVPSTGLGEPVADRATVGFRVFTMDPTNQQSSTTWTAVGPAPTGGLNSGNAGSVSTIAVDPSDPSGNTVYAGGSSGGVWKTTNFLTTDPNGPTWVPLTDTAPTLGMNIGSIAVLGRNNDPSQSIVVVGTGDGNARFGYGGNIAPGVGFLISLDGGASWSLMDSTNNTLPFASRDHEFSAAPNGKGSTSVMKVVIDPHLTPTGQAIIYAAMAGANGGLWRSTDTGQTWLKLSTAAEGDATDVVLDFQSATIDAISNPTGNVNTIYAAFPGSGVYISPNRGQVLNLMSSIGVTPLIVDTSLVNPRALSVSNVVNPTGVAGGRIALVRPTVNPSWTPTERLLYDGWLYAAISKPDGTLDAVYMTKDNGQNWVKLRIPSLPYGLTLQNVFPTNDTGQADTDPLASHTFSGGSYDLAFTVDPTNPNVVYLGGTTTGFANSGLIRIDTTLVSDAHGLVAYNPSRPDGGATEPNTTGRLVPIAGNPVTLPSPPYLNLIQDPNNPFQVGSAYGRFKIGQSFTNDGSGVTWVPFLGALDGSTGLHQMISTVDPLTGRARLLIADDNGVFSGVDINGAIDNGIGNTSEPTVSRNGNLQVAQFFYGAVQPNNALANQVGSLIDGNGFFVGQTSSSSTVLSTGTITSNGTNFGEVDGTGIATGVGPDVNNPTVSDDYTYRFLWPALGGAFTEFFQVSINGGGFIGRTSGLLQTGNDPQWPTGYTPYANGIEFGNFAVNPINGDQVIISSNAGRVFSTTNAGQSWLSIGEPGSLDGSYADALAYGAPDPNGPAGIGNLNNFLYAGTVNGNIFVTQTGGGTFLGGNAWTNISAGLDGSPVMKIVTDPARGNHDAYAVTQKGVYFIANSLAAGASWTKITGNLFSINLPAPLGNSSYTSQELTYLTSIQADWRYAIPNTPGNPGAGTHPALYVSGNAGVYQSLDNGASWSVFPNAAIEGNAPSLVNPVTYTASGATNFPTFTDGSTVTSTIKVPDAFLAQLNPTTGQGVTVQLNLTSPVDPDLQISLLPPPGLGLAPIVLVPRGTGTGGMTANFTNTIFDDASSTPIANGSAPFTGRFKPQNPLNSLIGQEVNGIWTLQISDLSGTGNDPGGVLNSWSLTFQQGPPSGLPNVAVTDLSTSLGKIDPTTGRPVNVAGDSNLLVASTFGRGQYAIQLAPIVMPNTGGSTDNFLFLDKAAPNNFAGFTTSGVEYTSNAATQIFDGLSEQSAFGNKVNIQAFDETVGSANFGKPIPLADAPVVTTDANGNFKLTVNNYFTTSGTYTIGFQATNVPVGSQGKISTFTFVLNGPPPAPTAVVLDPLSDSGTFNNDEYTFDNNSSEHPAPIFDVSGIQASAAAPAMVVLERATVTNGVVGAYSVVNQITTTTGGTVQIADTNGGNGTIADTQINTSVDAAPPQPNQYLYTAYQINSLGTAGPVLVPSTPVIVDTVAPPTPTSITLDPSTDTGPSNTDNYTSANNTPAHPGPTFDVTGIEPHATVVLLRGGVEVARLTDSSPTGAKATVQISDTNTGQGQIADSPLGNPIDTLSSANPYQYSAYQIDLAGNVSGIGKPVFGNSGAVVIDGTDADNHGDNNGPGGTVEAGWLYMKNVLQLIQPNITNGQKVLVALGAHPGVSGGGFGGGGSATKAIDDAFLQSTLPGLGWSLVYVNGAANIDAYLSGQPATAVDASNNPLPNVTLAQTGFLYITTVGHPSDDMTQAELGIVDNHGPDIANYVNGGGGLYTQTESALAGFGRGGGGQQSPSYGWLSAVFPGLVQVSVASQNPVGFTITPAGTAAFPSLTVAEVSAGPWHNYFEGNFGVLDTVLTATDTDQQDTQNFGTQVSLILTTAGAIAGGSSSALGVVIDSTAPVAPGLTLDPGSDTGPNPGDGITQDNNGQYPAPIFDATNIEPNATVNLYRNGTLVATFTQTPTQGPSAIQIADTNGGNGVIPNGTYTYTVTQTDLAGNVSQMGSTVVTVNAGLPLAPTGLKLEAGSDTGFSNADGVTKDNNGNPFPAPIFDVSGIIKGATLELFRSAVVNGVPGAPVLVNSLVSANGGAMSIADTNGGNGTIPDGHYFYSTEQVDLSGNISLPSNGVAVTIDSLPPQADPPSKPVLEATSDTGTFNNDDVTSFNDSTPARAPVFDAGTNGNPVESGATVQLFRAPVVNGLTGTPVLVNTLTDTQGGVIPIADTKGLIPDGTYVYSLQLTSLAGVTGTVSPGQKVVIVQATPALPSPFRLDPVSDTGVSNSDGITQITLVAHPTFDVGPASGASGNPVQPGATVILYRASGTVGTPNLSFSPVNTLTNTAGGQVKITDPGVIADGKYVYRVQQVDLAGNQGPVGGDIGVTYDTAQPQTPAAPVLDLSNPGNPASNQTSSTTPIFDIAVNLPNLEANSSVTLVRVNPATHATTPVNSTPYTATTGTVKLSDPTGSFGTFTYQAFITDQAGNTSALSGPVTIVIAANAPGTLNLDPSSNTGPPGRNITSATTLKFDVSGTTPNDTLRLLRNGLQVNSVATGSGGALTITDPGPLVSGTYVYTTEQVDSLGHVSPPGPALTVTVDTSIPTTPVLLGLDRSTDSGVQGDNITNVNKPEFDVTGVTQGTTLQLLRNGAVVLSTATITAPTATITDTGPVPDGTYTYTVRQVSLAGNPSLSSGSLSLKIVTAAPTPPTIALDPNSVGPQGGTVTNATSPFFDVSGVVPGNTVQLLRGTTLVKTISAATGNPVVIQDFGPLSTGNSYTYTAIQIDQAGNTSLAGPPLTITVNTTQPQLPTTPTLVLDPSADSGIKGDNITDVRQPIFSGKADPNATINLFNNSGKIVGTNVANALGNFSVQVSTPQANGTYLYQAQAVNSLGKASNLSVGFLVSIVTEPGDFTGNGNTQPALFRQTTASQLQWFVLNDASINGRPFGASSTDVPLVGDFTGAGRVDLMTYTPGAKGSLTGGVWTIETPATNYTSQIFLKQFGMPGIDIPAPADYLGLHYEQAAVYEPTNGYFVVHNPGVPGMAGDIVYKQLAPFFKAGDIPVPGNYDNTGKAEPAIYDPSTQTWYIAGPTSASNPSGVYKIGFGGIGDIPVPGSYFATATSQADTVAVWRPSVGNTGVGEYLIRTPNGGTETVRFQKGDIPAPGDYDGIGITEPAVYRPGANPPVFLVEGPNDLSPRVVAPIGGTNFVPLLSPYNYRALKSGGGTVSIFSVKAGSTDFASSAVALSTSSSNTTVLSNGPVPGKAATSATIATTTAANSTTLRVRPAQEAAPQPTTTHPVDAVLGAGARYRRLFSGLN